MPRRSNRTELEEREYFVDDFQHNQIIWMIANDPDILMRERNTMVDVSGYPTFLFMKECHDRYRDKMEDYWRFAQHDENRITHYGAYAEAVLRSRTAQREDMASMLDLFTPAEHPRVTEYIRLTRTGPRMTSRQAIRVLRQREMDSFIDPETGLSDHLRIRHQNEGGY